MSESDEVIEEFGCIGPIKFANSELYIDGELVDQTKLTCFDCKGDIELGEGTFVVGSSAFGWICNACATQK